MHSQLLIISLLPKVVMYRKVNNLAFYQAYETNYCSLCSRYLTEGGSTSLSTADDPLEILRKSGTHFQIVYPKRSLHGLNDNKRSSTDCETDFSW